MLNNRYNFLLLTRNIVLGFWYADWKKSYQKSGFLGIIAEFFRALFGLNTWPFFIDSKGGWNKRQIQKLITPRGIKMWGWGYSQGQFFFRVKRNQALWCQYLLLENGVPVRGRLLQGHYNPDISAEASADNDETDIHERPKPQKSKKSHKEPHYDIQSASFNLFDEINKIIDSLSRL